jgi:hypothetical protein
MSATTLTKVFADEAIGAAASVVIGIAQAVACHGVAIARLD